MVKLREDIQALRAYETEKIKDTNKIGDRKLSRKETFIIQIMESPLDKVDVGQLQEDFFINIGIDPFQMEDHFLPDSNSEEKDSNISDVNSLKLRIEDLEGTVSTLKQQIVKSKRLASKKKLQRKYYKRIQKVNILNTVSTKRVRRNRRKVASNKVKL